MTRSRRPWRLLSAAIALGAASSFAAACRKANGPTEPPRSPSVRLYFMSTVAGALEPCGCRKDMLGGVDHAAALLASRTAEAPQRLLLAAGPTLFQDPSLSPDRREQDLWKAEALAASLGDLGLAALAPGVNDFAAGTSLLGELLGSTGARLLGANAAPTEVLVPTATFQVGEYKVGVAGIAATPDGVPSGDPAPALSTAAEELARAGAQIRIALISRGRGDALRLLERVQGFDVAALGKASDRGEANDAAFPPVLVGDTLVVQAPNHLQALAYVDLFVRNGNFDFADASRIADTERREALQGRVGDLERRLAGLRAEDDGRRSFEVQLEGARRELAELERRAKETPPPSGSFFRYELIEVRESAGSDPKVAQRMLAYYRRVNEHNRVAFRDRAPAPAPSGTSSYVGGAACASCHGAADAFWRQTQHATAYATLTREFKEFNLDCVGCHVTGYNRPGGSTVTHVQGLTDVQCEACHGPGSRHVESSGDTSFITLTPADATCRSCHHTPHVLDDWDVRASWQKIVGPGHGAPSTPQNTPATAP